MTLPASPSPPLSPFEARWLAEVVRRHEEQHGLLEDAAEPTAAPAAAPDFEGRILLRADRIGAREGWRAALLAWQRRARLLLLAALALALVLGFGTAAGVLGDGSRPVNVVWTLGGLLGVHGLSLLLWLSGMLLSGRMRGGSGIHAGGVLGRGWLRLVAVLDRSRAAAELPLALAGLLGRGRLAAWGVSAVSHALWLAALLGATLGVLLLLATRRYGFVWETTILPADSFVGLSAALGALPAALGFPVPDAAMVAASGEAPLLEEGGRRAWAGWLLGALVVYGVLPRLLFALGCAALWRRGLRRLRLDLSRPGYARLRAVLMPDSARIGVSDPAPAALPCPHRPPPPAGHGAAAVAVAIELGDDLAWPPAVAEAAETGAGRMPGGGWEDGGRLDSREQRRAALGRLAARPPARLLVAVDARQTPDRGTLGLVAELAERAVATRVWLCAGTGAPAGRAAQWRAGLGRIGLDAAALFEDAARVRAWLENPEADEA
ncbi:DUF2868 domain-containing protein [Thauera chlorobenzoica]|uniref:Putative membrane protein n=1 Tax=Thauera chlorobenzoica TaxID=96773 RepID=A0A1H5T4G0_9RHOO|nr:DUF2868 domain-containing protein [Thauera chlorobenzoica]APR04147.1 putative membrane protein [Thauera chlorobenzoica]SEF56971.1 Protein of unknown function [Thauera chlorobenzoica]